MFLLVSIVTLFLSQTLNFNDIYTDILASSVTSYGRNLLFETRSFVENKYTIANGFSHNAEVVYGDTDSVMVKFGPTSVEEAMPLAERAADEVIVCKRKHSMLK